jgi:hypothetical protein
MREVMQGLFLGRHPAPYDQCGGCGFLQVRSPHWLDEAYSDAIALMDTGLVQRNLDLAELLCGLLPAMGLGPARDNRPFLDFGGGLGLLVRLMRDRGFDFRWLDAYARNELARGFEYDAAMGPCAAVTAFEVLEHTVDPGAFVREALAAGQSDMLVFSTELYAGDLPPADWWYFAPEGGQHIAFFRRDTLEALARSLGMNLASRKSVHVLSRRPVGDAALRKAQSRPGRLLARLRTRKGGLTGQDHLEMASRLRAGTSA